MMNERIRELVRESNLDVYGLGKERYKWEYTVEKFAELIIKECLDQCYNRGMNDEMYAGQLKAAAYIEEHFGVEE
jgi:hypothetical protein